jgi:hypothetical protein
VLKRLFLKLVNLVVDHLLTTVVLAGLGVIISFGAISIALKEPQVVLIILLIILTVPSFLFFT